MPPAADSDVGGMSHPDTQTPSTAHVIARALASIALDHLASAAPWWAQAGIAVAVALIRDAMARRQAVSPRPDPERSPADSDG